MPTLTKQIEFFAAHYYWDETLSDAENQAVFHACANRHGHGHNYQVEVTLSGSINANTGMLINFTQLEPILKTAVLDPLDHKNLNHEVPFFQHTIPTLENIAVFIWQQLLIHIKATGLILQNIKVIENERLWVQYDGRVS